jgi:hypothetical protein
MEAVLKPVQKSIKATRTPGEEGQKESSDRQAGWPS